MAMSEAASISDISSALSGMKKLRLKSSRKSNNGPSRQESTTGTNESFSGSSRPSISEPTRRKSSMISLPSRFRRGRKASDPDILEVSKHNRQSLGQRFCELPAEIQVAVLAYLDVTELLALRQTSRTCHAIFQANSSSIARNALHIDEKGVSAQFMIDLYPPLFSSGRDDAYLLRMLRREKLIRRQMHVLLTFIQTRVYMMRLTSGLPSEHFAPYRDGIYRTLYQPVGLMQHLLETKRYLLVHVHPHHSNPETTRCAACINQIRQTIETYPVDQLVPLFHTIELIMVHFRTATRTPSSVTPFERRIRGWSYGPPPEEHMSQFVLLGGMAELSKVNEMQGSYAKRLGIVKIYCDQLAEAVKYNSTALDDIFQTGRDPVLCGTARAGGRAQVKADQDIRLSLEKRADESNWGVTSSLDVSMHALTEGVLKSVPPVGEAMVGPQAVLHKRIMDLELVSSATDLISPYQYVRQLMAECYEATADEEPTSSIAM